MYESILTSHDNPSYPMSQSQSSTSNEDELVGLSFNSEILYSNIDIGKLVTHLKTRQMLQFGLGVILSSMQVNSMMV